MTPSPAPAPKPVRRKPGCLSRLVMLLAATVFALLLAELVVRMLADEVLPNPIGPRHLFRRDPVLGIDLRPGFAGRFKLKGEFDVAVKISAQGFRDREFGPKRPGVQRIMSLGDSFAFGYGVEAEQTYAKVLENLLNDGAEPRKVEVLNAGASGRGILHEIEVLERHAAAFQPDVVLLEFFYVNDLLDIKLFPEHTERGGIVVTRFYGTAVDHNWWLRFSVNYSELSLLLWRTKFNLEMKAQGQSFRLGDQATPGRIWGTDLLRTAADPKHPDQFAETERLWQQFEKHLATLAADCARVHAKLLVFAIPQEYQTRDPLWEQMKRDKEVDDQRFDRHRIGKKLTEICARQHVAFFDLVPGFRQTPPKVTRFFPKNKHFNTEGNAFTAELLAKHLRAIGFIR
ncbi:MAG: hypothetical protein KDC87_12415 [Planctomycetes bacterium]|nr:hypothetical protein [Planctomycetota bacterium]